MRQKERGKKTMIELVQAGQAGKTELLFDMHRLRGRVFKDIMDWNVKVNTEGLEVDQFDIPEAVYLLALNTEHRVIGSWRLLPTTGPTMIRDIWPQFLKSLPLPSDPSVWEVSRFAVHVPIEDPKESQRQSQIAIGEMFCALTEACIATGIHEIYTLYDDRIAKIIRRIDCHPHKVSDQFDINGMPCQVGAFKTDTAMLKKLHEATGINAPQIKPADLPLSLSTNLQQTRK